MLTTTGARTGLPRTVPVLGFPIQDDVAVAAGNFGRAQDPAWCLNLRRDPHARIVVDGHIRRVVADELAGDAREAVWQQCLAIYPGGTAYATSASARTIAVFLLRADSSRFDGPVTAQCDVRGHSSTPEVSTAAVAVRSDFPQHRQLVCRGQRSISSVRPG
jgi:deazaflavin-dependent oxidoreductase (nitroreductase family)